jgi:hypothetical protein
MIQQPVSSCSLRPAVAFIVTVLLACSPATPAMKQPDQSPRNTGGRGNPGRGGSAGSSNAGSDGRDSAIDPDLGDAAGPETTDVPAFDAISEDPPTAPPPPPGACAKLFGGGAVSAWAHYDDAGKLVYKTIDARGDRIMDYSTAGYRGGGVALPAVPTAMTIGPSGGDDSDAIQAALNAVSQLPLVDGFRGALLLKPGSYTTTKTITIAASGVVLRGSGAGAGGTTIDLPVSHLFLAIRGVGPRQANGPKATITDDYVPAGGSTFSVDDASGFKVGDQVLIGRPVTAAWVHFMGMDTLVRDGLPQSWVAVGSVQSVERSIAAIAGNKVTLDIPVSDSFDGQYVKPPGGSMQKFSFAGRLSQVGLESLRVTAPVRSAAQATDPAQHGGSQFLDMTNTADSWIRDVVGHNTVEGIHISGGSVRITVQDTVIDHDPTDYFTSSAPFDFSVDASQVLIHRCSSKGGNKIFSYATQHALGPNVVLNFLGEGRAQVQPHQRWATGLLLDNVVDLQAGTGTGAGICFLNRGTGGSGHGWSQGWGVAWNCTSPSTLLHKPPGSMIWAIGCKTTPSGPTAAPGIIGGAPIPDGIYESLGQPVAPNSLYLAQLCERLGPQALQNIGYR